MEQTGRIRDYRDLIVWRKSIDLVKHVYALSQCFPKEERYALADQIRRAAVSIPSNIAEGSSRTHKGEFRQFISIALGSTAEVDTQSVIAFELGYIDKTACDETHARIDEIRRMLRGLQSALKD